MPIGTVYCIACDPHILQYSFGNLYAIDMLTASLQTTLETVGTNSLDGGAPFYNTYTCKDGKHVGVGAIEPQFFDLLVKGMGFSAERVSISRSRDQSS